MSIHKNQALLNLIKASLDTFLPFYKQLNLLNRSKSFFEAKWALGRIVGFLLGIPLGILAFQLSNRISAHVHLFYVDEGPFPFFLFAPVWVEILLFLGGLIMVVLSFAAPIFIIYYALRRISRKKYCELNAKIADTWTGLRTCINDWKDCPITLEYSHPQWITAIYNTIESERANTVDEAIQLLEEDERHRQAINGQAEAQRVFLEEQKRKRRAKEAEDDFMLLFWLNETI